MSLSSTSNTINTLGIFGRLEPDQEKYFKVIQDKLGEIPENHEANGIFNHLSLVIDNNVPVNNLPTYLDLLRELRLFLPLTIDVSRVIIKDDKHLALSFDPDITKPLRSLASKFIPDHIIETYYTKVVWFVPQKNIEPAIKILEKTNQLVFTDFKLCANRQDDAHTIYSSLKF
jgi:hypothetical protein